MASKRTFTVGCTMQADQFLAFLVGDIIETVATYASVAGLERLREAATHGFRRAIVSRANAPKKRFGELEVIAVERLVDALEATS